MGSSLPASTNIVRTSFLRWIHEEEEHERLASYRLFNEYYYGNQRVNLPPKIQKALEQQQGIVLNYCRPVVDITIDFLCGKPIGIDVSRAGVKDESAYKAEQLLYYVYKRNKLLFGEMIKLLRIIGKKGDAFIKLFVENSDLRIEVLRPDIVFPHYRDDNYNVMDFCVIKWFDLDEDGDRHWKAQVFRADVVEYYYLGEKPSTWGKKVSYGEYREGVWVKTTKLYGDDYEQRGNQWQLISVEKNPLGFIPIIHIKNNIDDLPYGVSDLQVMIEPQNALNKAVTDLFVALDTQAFQRLFLMGAYGKAEIDLSPGTVIEVPNEAATIQTVQPANISSMLMAVQEAVRQICAVAQIPQQVFIGYAGVPISGYALEILFTQLTAKCKEKMENVINSLQELNRMIFYVAGLMGMADYNSLAGLDTNIHFTSGLPMDKVSNAQVHGMQLQSRTKSKETVMEEEGIENIPEEKRRIYQEMYEDFQIQMQMNAMLAQTAPKEVEQ